MEFMRLLSTVVVCFASVEGANASGNLKLSFSNDVCNGVNYNINYSCGMRSCSDGSSNIEDLAGSINNISQGAMSVRSSERECIDSMGCNYTIGLNDGGTRNLIVLNEVDGGSSLNKLFLNGDAKNPTLLQMNFSDASNMRLPSLECNNMAILKFKAKNVSSGDAGSIGNLTVDAPTGLFYNIPLKINGGRYSVGDNNGIDSLRAIANKGINNIKFANGGRYNLGVRYNIPGITDVLEKRGLKIASIEVSNTVPAGVKVLKLHEVNGLVQSNAGVVTVDMRMAPHNPRIDKPFRKLFTSGMISTTMYQAGIWDEKQKQEVMDSNYLSVSIL